MRFALVVVAVLLVMTSGAPARGQVGAIEALLKRATGVDLYGEVGALTHSKALTTSDYWSRDLLGDKGGLRGTGLEFLFDMDELGVSREHWSFEMGVGYDNLRGLTASEPSLDLHCSIRELPSLTVYGLMPYDLPLGLTPYVGISTGWVQLVNAQAYDSAGTIYSLDASTYELGLLGGFYEVVSKDRAWVFIEGSFRHRKFDSVKWSSPNQKLPNRWPRSLDADAALISAGLQVRFGKS
jgi:hypothetical protein